MPCTVGTGQRSVLTEPGLALPHLLTQCGTRPDRRVLIVPQPRLAMVAAASKALPSWVLR